MSIDRKVVTLQKKHASLEQNLLSESNRPLPDVSAISSIKREKLNVKDEIERLSN